MKADAVGKGGDEKLIFKFVWPYRSYKPLNFAGYHTVIREFLLLKFFVLCKMAKIFHTKFNIKFYIHGRIFDITSCYMKLLFVIQKITCIGVHII